MMANSNRLWGKPFVVASAFVASSIIALAPDVSIAQIPSMDEYSVGSGTRVIKKKAADTYSSDSFSITSSKFSVANIRDKMQKIVPEVKSELWGDVANNIRAVDGQIDSKNFGYSSFASMTSDFGIDASAGKDIESIREDLLFSVQQLKDLALSKRVLFFNKEDLEIMKNDGLINGKAAKDADPAAVEEALGYIKDINGLLDDLERVIVRK